MRFVFVLIGILFLVLVPDINLAQKYKILAEHKAAVNAVAFSPNGKLLATASSDRKIIVWNALTGEKIRELTGHTASVNSIDFSPDGKYLASGSSDKTVRYWSVETGNLLKTNQKHTAVVEDVCFSPDGKSVASCGWDSTTTIWEPEAGWEESFYGSENTVYSVAFSPDGKLLASAGADMVVRVWQKNSGNLVSTMKGHFSTIRCLAFHPNGKILATGTLDNHIKLWEVETGACLKSIDGHEDAIRAVVFSPDGRILASASKDGTIRFWNVRTGEVIRTLQGHRGALWDCVFSSDGTRFATASADKTARIWDVSSLNITPAQNSYLPEDAASFKPPVDIDQDVPSVNQVIENRFALIIGNEDYQSYQPSLSPEMNVEFAKSDALIFRKYAETVLGIPSRNILLVLDGTSARMRQEIQKLSLISKNANGQVELFFFYAGHGVPDEVTKESYLLPVDVNASQPEQTLRLADVLNQLAESNPIRLTAFVDACFSGKARDASPLTMRGVKIIPKPVALKGNTVLFSASSSDQPALPWRQAKHGIFTYTLLKHINLSKGNISYSVLAEKLQLEVNLQALLLHNREQIPTIQSALELGDSWKSWRLVRLNE
ncbi:MAG: caspase family protein [Bacteroidia bacterium]|nr:caspase family protein [Bacteroidia bacterium]